MKTQRIPIQSPRLFRPINNAQTELYEEPHEQKWSLLKKHSKLRESTIDFLVKACIKFQFKKDTLFLAIKIMDILIKESFQPFLEDFQLTAASLVILTTKYNEVYPVTIDQINLVTEKYYPRASIIKTEGLVLECLNFEIPEVTVFSELYNELKPHFGKKISSDSDKQNEGDRKNLPPRPTQKAEKHDEQVLISKTLKAIKQPESLKYGEQFLFKGLLGYIRNEKSTGSSVNIVKSNYIRTVIKRVIEPEKEGENRRPEMPKYLSPRDLKLNPENRLLGKQKIFVF